MRRIFGWVTEGAYFVKIPCTTLRDQTEWVETLENGWNVLTPIIANNIIQCANRPLDCLQYPQPSLFGDGHAVEKICQAIVNGGEF